LEPDCAWTYGALANHLYGVPNDGSAADLSTTFITKGLGQGATVAFKVGAQLMSLAGGARVYLDAPSGGPEWGLRFVVTLLYPR
jgi:hypothetical protein